MAAEAELTEKLERTMPTKMRQGRAYCRAAARGVPSMEAFGQILPQVVEVAAQQYLRHATVYPRHRRRTHRTDPADGAHGTDELPPRDTRPCDGCGGHG